MLTLGLESDDDAEGVARAAALVAQLPDESRLCRGDDPDRTWGPEAHMLRLIEYDLRVLIYAMGRRKGQRPKPIDLPSDARRRRHAADTAEAAKCEVDEILSDILSSESEVGLDG